jgi:transcriptional repressor NrdR
MRCPFCDFENSKVLDSRPADEGRSIRRRRECLKCQKRFTTYEKIEARPLIVVKKDGRREVFDSKKLLGGMARACEKRPISYEKLEEIGERIDRE